MHSSSSHSQNDRLTTFLGNLHPSCVQGDFDGASGLFRGLDVQEVRLVRDRETDQPRGHGYAVFKNQDSLEKALELDGSMVCGQKVKIDLKRPKTAGGGGAGGGYSSRGGGGGSRDYSGFSSSRQQQSHHADGPFMAFVANLPEGATDKDLISMFQSLDLKSAHLARHRDTGEARGFGFAEFKNKESLNQALTLSGAEWMGKVLKVSVHEPKVQSSFPSSSSSSSSNFPSFSNNNANSSDSKQWGHQPQSRFPGDPSWQPSSSRSSAVGGEDPMFRKSQSVQPKPTQEPLPLEIDDKDRPKLVLKKAEPKKAGSMASTPAAATSAGDKKNPFGNARPVDTASKLQSMEEAKQKQAAEAAAKLAAEEAEAAAASED
ncbi:hypothetical protein BASA81_001479 [Batrachochytrium salamandrivorans]|nr:hypothetical protein BASA81_001479 [Batrachochytrium salamandrivorans]